VSRRPRFVLTPQARADLLEIWTYIAEDSPENADRVLERLHAAFTRLAEMPGMGHHREDLADARHRFWTVFSYVIAYRDQTSPLEIIAIVHGARQLEAFFQHRIGGQAFEAAE
jgi:plasmid stabilization system protein ParE